MDKEISEQSIYQPNLVPMFIIWKKGVDTGMNSPADARKLHYRLGAFAVLVSLLWLLVFLLSIVSSMPVNPVSQLIPNPNAFKSVFPQGWGFYSKNPRDDQLLVYDLSTQRPTVNWPNNRTENWFGIKRSGRAQGLEVGLIQASIKSDAWTKCEKEPSICLAESQIKVSAINTSPKPTLCNELGLALQQPVPWAWSKRKDNIVMPSKIVRVSVQCSKK